LPLELFPAESWQEDGSTTVTCLRSVLMKPEHLDWVDRIWEIFLAAVPAGW
jgi:tyrosine decarboxylase/aspartate 1-decarboxylase